MTKPRRPIERRDDDSGLTLSQRWHLHRGEKFYRYSGFRLDRTPFSSPEARRQAWEDHKAELMAEARTLLPETVHHELLLVERYRRPGTTWAFRQFPGAQNFERYKCSERPNPRK